MQDRSDGSTTLVCVASDGTPANSECAGGAISGNGRYVVFASSADNLVPDEPADECGDDDDDDPPPCRNVYRHDLDTGLTETVSIPAFGGVDVGNSFAPAISADGNVVAFGSLASNLVGSDNDDDGQCDASAQDCDTNGKSDIFVRDMISGVTTRASVSSTGAESDGVSLDPSLSANGRWLAFASVATNFDNDPGSSADIFVHDRVTGLTEGLGYDNFGQVTGESYDPSISSDGSRVAFISQANNLVLGDANPSWNAFMYDRTADESQIVDVRTDGSVPASGQVDRPDITPDGRLVAFRSTYDLTGDGAGGLYVRDMDAGVTTPESVDSAGQPMAGADVGENDLISDDGRFAAFWVYDNGVSDIYVHDRGPAVGESETGSGTVTTDSEGDGATVFDPLEATVTSAQPGQISVTEVSPATQQLPGRYATIGQQVDITAPDALPGAPLVIRFLLDASIVPPSTNLTTLAVFRNGVQVDACLVAGTPDPSPCVVSRTRLPDGDVEIIVHTLRASSWNVALQLPGTGADITPPSVTINQPGDGATYEVGSSVTVAFTCSDDVELASCQGDQPSGSPLNTHQVGPQTFAVHAADAAGNDTTVTATYRVVYPFTGFFSPVDNDAVSIANAGRTIPVKWQLQSAATTVSDPASFVGLTSRRVNCATLAAESVDAIENYTNASGLLYQGSGSWQFNWKTPKSYAGQCRTMTVTLSDGTTHHADFQFK